MDAEDTDDAVPTELNEEHELEFDELELHREWAAPMDSDKDDRTGTGNLSVVGVIQVGALTSSAIMAKSCSSSSVSSSRSC